MKNVEITNFEIFSIPKNSKIFIEICMKMKNFEIEKFRKFSISKFSDDNFIIDPDFLLVNRSFHSKKNIYHNQAVLFKNETIEMI